VHDSLLKAARPELPTGLQPFLLFRRDAPVTYVFVLVDGTSSCFDYTQLSFFVGKAACCFPPNSPTASTSRLLVPSLSLTRCELVQTHHQHLCSRVPLDPIHHVIYLGDYLVWALPRGLEFGRLLLHAGWPKEPHFVALLVIHRVGQAVVQVSFGHWPEEDAGRELGAVRLLDNPA
jgi:hypothetical protein